MLNDIDKNLVINNFKKSLETYDNNAFIQKTMAKKLIDLIDKKYYKDVFEIGCYSGVLTRLAFNDLNFSNYYALDIVDVSKYLNEISLKINFINCDIEKYNTDKKFDLIVANAALQWCYDFNYIIKKLKSFLKDDGTIAISIFSNENLAEIKDIFNVGLNYPEINDLKALFSKDVTIIKDKIPLQFENSIDILRHLKYTGVNSVQKNKFSYKELKKGLFDLQNKYNNTLTYYPIYIIG